MKTFKLFSMAALALVMAACSSEENEILQQPEQQQGKMHFTATIAAPNSDPTTRSTATADGDNYNVAWKVGDVIALVYTDSESDRQKDEATVTAVDGSGNATIECDLNHTVSDGADVTLVYPSAVVFGPDEDLVKGMSYTFDDFYFTSQEGAAPTDENGIPKYDWRDGDGTFSVNGSDVTLSGNVTMNPNVAIWKITLQDEATDALVANMMFIERGGPVAAVTGYSASEYYVYVPVPQLNFLNSAFPAKPLVITGNIMGDDYSYVHSGAVTLTAGKIYESTVTLKQVLSGWIHDSGDSGCYIYYIDGETWAQAIANHSNWNFEIRDGKVYSPAQMKYLKNAAGTDYIDPATAVDPSETYSWGD